MTIPKIANASRIDSPSWDRVCECTPATKWQGSLWELSPWQHKHFLVLCCHSPTQHLQTDGISLPPDSVSPSVVLVSVPLVHAIVSPALQHSETYGLSCYH